MSVTVLGTTVCVGATIQVRMPLLLPVTAVIFGGWGLLTVLRAHITRRSAATAHRDEARRVEAEWLRIGDAERDQVTTTLREHFSAGRLNPTELEERLAAALEAKTAVELAPLLADLPADRPAR
ncbi:hypothetical protein GCM10023191_101670 [Actinoallomurus oryzae]|uniref:DUF1707 domain-containing protein n=1 Tax=Actinoallomurus oryzae TaxID=502180 RepID=A0ABP8R9D3_9ACTN